MATITKKLAVVGAFAPLAALAEGENTIPGLTEAISQAQSTATSMAGAVVPGAVSIVFAFAGLLGVYLVWKILRRAAR